MDRASMFYSQPSRMSSYPTYGRTQVKQRGGMYSNEPPDWAKKAVLGTMGLLAGPFLSGMVGIFKQR